MHLASSRATGKSISRRWMWKATTAGGWLLVILPCAGWGQTVNSGTEDSRQIAPSQAPAEADLATIRARLRELEAGELVVRDQAEKQIISMGPAVLGFLPDVTARTSGELKVRLQRIRQALQQSNIEHFFEASLITLNGQLKLADAIEQIVQQTNNPIKLDEAVSQASIEVQVAANDAPFWEVMTSIMSQAKLRINSFGTTENELVLTSGGTAGSTNPSFVSGPFRLDVLSVRSTLPFNASLGGQLDLSFAVTWEPRLKPVFMQLPMSTLAAEYAGGQPLAATNPQAAPEIPLNLGGSSTHVDVQLQRPPRTVQQLDKLTGEFTIAVPSQRHQYVFKKFGNGARQSEKFGDVTVTLEGARRNGAVYEMRLFVEFGDSQGALDSFRGWILSNEAYLRDGRDTRILNVGLNTYAVTPNAVGIAYLFQINGNPDDYQLIYESPAAVTKQRVKYELKDIELP
jgi:predicted transcriptional regulator